MNIFKTALLCLSLTALSSCASGYKPIQPESINYISSQETGNVKLEYKYDLLDKKYAKKEIKKGVKLVAVKITNNSDKDLTFGSDLKLTYSNDSTVVLLDNDNVFKTLKQQPATHLLYLLLTPVNLYTTESRNGVEETTSSTPIGLILGPGLAGGNMIAASSANKKFKTEMLDYNINGTEIKQGETKFGLVGIKSNSFDTLKLKVE
ncbi:hypothetical protein HNV08_05285 [Winogradskyella eckloniae]|uniref:hypothetical protein n=1 Tax=Winogradskyella eckloniae TaxID=1089306 RepID=UPI0015663319|nr:hypothetical protein [Winogradskyella eckloniae]NRD19452.1 hypothetical protein [Winogradskyella eckloniae]